MRQEFSKKTKLQAWNRANGFCEGCHLPLKGKRVEYDHDKPDAFGGAATIENCVVLCVACHSHKTRTQDVPRIAKTNRIRKREAGIKKKPSFQGWRKMNGDIVRAR